MKEKLKLEVVMGKYLRFWYKEDEANAFESRYFTAKDKLYTDILPVIAKVEPLLTDHSEDHIDNVLDNVFNLISTEVEKRNGDVNIENGRFTPLDIYFLCQASLFHDVGNIFGRMNHNQEIQTVITDSFNQLFEGKLRRERKIIVRAGRAHTGRSSTGSRDTLSDLQQITEQYDGNLVNLCSVAAIIRFADELAEGPQRTSHFMLKHDMLKHSKLYHEYSAMTNITIDMMNSRIAIVYDIDINTDKYKTREEIESYLTETLKFVYGRILKLDEERKYYNYYCKLSPDVKEIQVTFEIEKDGNECNVKIQPLVINDLVVPGASFHDYPFTASRDDLELDSLVSKICDEVFEVE